MTPTDVADASRLLGWAARPKERPARHEDYGRLVRRYLDDSTFATTCDAVAAGAGITLHVDPTAGAVAVAEHDSPWRMPISELMRRGGTERRGLVGAILCSVAKVAFPQSAHLDDPDRVARVSVGGVVDHLDRIAERLGQDAPDAEADDPGAAELWRAWASLRRGRHDAQRASFGDQTGAVKKLCKFLEVEGQLQWVGDDDGGTWRATPRFRTAVAALAEDSDIYAALIRADATPSAGAEEAS